MSASRARTPPHRRAVLTHPRPQTHTRRRACAASCNTGRREKHSQRPSLRVRTVAYTPVCVSMCVCVCTSVRVRVSRPAGSTYASFGDGTDELHGPVPQNAKVCLVLGAGIVINPCIRTRRRVRPRRVPHLRPSTNTQKQTEAEIDRETERERERVCVCVCVSTTHRARVDRPRDGARRAERTLTQATRAERRMMPCMATTAGCYERQHGSVSKAGARLLGV
jgi:hypothetical protein